MLFSGAPTAYLVMTMVRDRGDLRVESETVCFDRDLAFAMARDDGAHCAWVGVYGLDEDGRCVTGSAIYSLGSLEPPRLSSKRTRGAPAETASFS